MALRAMVVVMVVVVIVVVRSRRRGARSGGGGQAVVVATMATVAAILLDELSFLLTVHAERVAAMKMATSVSGRSIGSGSWTWSHVTFISLLIDTELSGTVEVAACDGGSDRKTREEQGRLEQHSEWGVKLGVS